MVAKLATNQVSAENRAKSFTFWPKLPNKERNRESFPNRRSNVFTRHALSIYFGALKHKNAPVAQLDRTPVYGTGGCRFESCRVYFSLATATLSWPVTQLVLSKPTLCLRRPLFGFRFTLEGPPLGYHKCQSLVGEIEEMATECESAFQFSPC